MLERIFFVSDLHGSTVASNKAINAAKFYNVKTIIIGGDLTGKALVPILETDCCYELEFQGKNTKIKKSEPEKLEEAKRQIRSTGSYFSVMTNSEYEELAENQKKMEEKFKEVMKEGLAEFFDKAEERLKEAGAKMYLIPGNDDYDEVAEFAQKHESEHVIFFDNRIVNLGDYQLLGYGYSNPTPWRTPREKAEKEIYKDLKKLVGQIDKNGIYVIHAPPYGTALDKAPKLTSEMKQVAYETQHVGSTSVRRIIEEKPPVLGLHGHIHESGGIDFVKSNNGASVPVINPGSEYSSGVLKGAIIELDSGKLAKYMFTKG